VADLVERFGSAKRPARSAERARPDGVDDATAAALGTLGKAFEVSVAARGFLYQFHRMSGEADLTLQDAVEKFRAAGRDDIADELSEVLVGRDVVDDKWTFQIVERYDAQYYSVFQAALEAIEKQLTAPPHLFEAEMKHREQQ
jgi:hypothetical protein